METSKSGKENKGNLESDCLLGEIVQRIALGDEMSTILTNGESFFFSTISSSYSKVSSASVSNDIANE